MITNEIEHILTGTYIALSELIDEFNIDLNAFCNGLKKQHVLQMAETHQTMARIALRTGIDRRLASSILKGELPVNKQSSLAVIINRLEQLANTDVHNKRLINKKGIRSVESIMHDVAPGATTVKSIIDELMALGCIEDRGHNVKFIANNLKLTVDKRQALTNISSQLEKCIKYEKSQIKLHGKPLKAPL